MISNSIKNMDEAVRVVGENWQKLTAEQRNVYEEMAKKEQKKQEAKYPNLMARDNTRRTSGDNRGFELKVNQ
ncbi:hypothetical protein QR680_013114 [Steinernema hermaphroditum]|uniref:HMG box domain-containing protein n=1 Tax=Steinernema hermaphroditum TaxID=289476 RepID=A0AA39M204_9BILA|nr:hypothetical protein QR680_013114 [Steinernema hermaphroditum]